MESSRDWWARALNSEVAFDGWAGALLGALASVAVAVLVVHLTKRHDRSLLEAQIVAQRNDALDQGRREAFAEVLAALDAFEVVPVDDEKRTEIQDRMKAATYGWMLYMTDLKLAEAVKRGCDSVIQAAAKNLIERGEVLKNMRATGFDAPDVRQIRNTLLEHGRVWHTDPMRQNDARKAILDAFPPRV